VSGAAGKAASGKGASGRGANGRAGAVAGQAGGKGDQKDRAELEHLTHEDEETWFEGSEDAGPEVWR